MAGEFTVTVNALQGCPFQHLVKLLVPCLKHFSDSNSVGSHWLSLMDGADGAINEGCTGSFSLAASASTTTKFIAKHAVLGTSRSAVFSQRDRPLGGARTFASSYQPGVDWALNLNTRELSSDAEFDDFRSVRSPRVFTVDPIEVR